MKVPTNLRGYSLERPLGKGGMGSVWIARKLTTNQAFAIKFLKEEYVEDAMYLARFEREVAALRAIRHPNVVNVFEWSLPKDDPDAKPYVVMELLEGDGLDRLLRRQRILQPQLAVAIMLQVLDGLAAAHKVGVIHRDLGPSNIFLTPQPNGTCLVRVLDFGLTRSVTSEEEVQLTQVGTLMGKPGYVASETFLGKPVDARGDIFACGMIFYRMLAGRLPHKETQAQHLWAERYAEKSHDREYAPIRELAEWVPEKLALVVGKAIRRNPDERYHTAEDMQVDLLDIEDSVLSRAGAAAASLPPRPAEVTLDVTLGSPQASRQRGHRPGRWAAIGGGALAAVVLAVVLLVWGLGGLSGRRTAPDARPQVASADSAGPLAPDVRTTAPSAPSGPADAVSSADEVSESVADAPSSDTETALVGADSGPKTVLVIVLGAPAGATIRIGDSLLEGDASRAHVPWSEDLLTVTIEARGFEKYQEMLLPTADRVVNVRMRPIRRVALERRDAGTASTGSAFPEFPEGP